MQATIFGDGVSRVKKSFLVFRGKGTKLLNERRQLQNQWQLAIDFKEYSGQHIEIPLQCIRAPGSDDSMGWSSMGVNSS